MLSERTPHESLFSVGPQPFSDGFAPAATGGERHVEVIHGVFAHSLPLVGMSIGQARSELQERMHIDPDAVPVLDGQEVDEDTVLAEGQVLNFVKRAGEKGRTEHRKGRHHA
jgi:hypothetical protein